VLCFKRGTWQRCVLTQTEVRGGVLASHRQRDGVVPRRSTTVTGVLFFSTGSRCQVRVTCRVINLPVS
jgi:hypothetical protein